jgi:hypothetical protein
MAIPSKAGLPQGPGSSDSALSQTSSGAAADTNSVGAVTNGQSVAFPAAADRTSAGGAKSVSDFVLKNGSVQPFPAASDTSLQPKMATNWDC